MRLVDLAALAATLLAVTGLWPQILRLLRTGDTAGVSLTWATLGAVTNVAWFAYVVHEGLWVASPCPAAMVVFYVALASVLARHGVAARSSVGAAAGWAVFLLTVTVFGGWAALGVVLGVAYAVQVAPSVWTAYRTWAPSGIAPATWLIGSVEITLWGTYGVAERDPAIMTFAVTGIVASAAILLRWFTTRHRFAPAVVTAAD